VISIFFDRLAKGQPLTIYGDGEQYRDFVHVSDVVQANLRAAALGKPGRVFNVGGGTKATIRDLAETMIEITGIEVPVESLDFRPGEVRRSVADVSRARRELGYEPLVDLEAGLEMMWGKVRSVDEEG
jgi:UDP-glucose 4-epimerase